METACNVQTPGEGGNCLSLPNPSSACRRVSSPFLTVASSVLPCWASCRVGHRGESRPLVWSFCCRWQKVANPSLPSCRDMLVGSNGEERTRITSVRVPMRYMCVVVELAQNVPSNILGQNFIELV